VTIRDLPAEIATWLDERGPSTVGDIASGIRARYVDVREALLAGAFVAAPRPWRANPNATYWARATVASPPFPSTPGGPGGRSQCARILGVLADGKEHEMREIHARAGFSRLNSRVSELRDKHFDIRCRKAGGRYFYKLITGPGALPGLPQVSAPEHIAEGEPRPDPIGVCRDGCEASPSASEHGRGVEPHGPGAAEDLASGPAAPTPLFEIPAPRGPGAYGNEAA